jgi:hypothetical protein
VNKAVQVANMTYRDLNAPRNGKVSQNILWRLPGGGPDPDTGAAKFIINQVLMTITDNVEGRVGRFAASPRPLENRI